MYEFEFSNVYDKLQDADYDKFYSYYKSVFSKYNLDPKLVLDLGCGTGSIAVKMAKDGYDMIGLDLSFEMLDIARKKAEKENADILFLNQDMTDFELYGTVDAIISSMDSINYITEDGGLLKLFKLCNNYLNPDGIFIFDINSEYKLKEVLGNHIEQAGSFVSSSRLRFDFTHFEAVSKEDLVKVEKIVNEKILEAINVTVEELPIEEAKKKGAMALFGEKYGDIVRVVSVGDYSVEFCGGTHLSNSSQAGSFKIVSENGVAAGVRRIEALTGSGVLNFYEDMEFMINNVKEILKVGGQNVINEINSLIEENKSLNKEIEQLKSKMSAGHIDEFINNKQDINGVSVVCTKIDGMEMNDLRNMGDKIKDKLQSGIVVLASPLNDKVSFVVMVTVKKGANAGMIVKAAATTAGGGGGGRPNMAQAGGKNPAKTDDALQAAIETIKSQLA